ncbi:polysaccharide deacetylase family protein [Mesorhizobium sp. LHD-90]|uniref:polysaccharide deacetylase family protein n=1 Tax=Mesorhizobium sp. LHD-90 TaxID=3071414 RepID=UPI0027DFBB61|nr:polysaccharide deacetylase family protein [Mesorhizobium sp. LHD-90]MDQ6436950.1 polysaccharide deacetylase family protein [Mesorhizobium sp. LHD-90]
MKSAIKHAVIRAGLEVFALPGIGALWPTAAGRGVIFTLHHVRPHRAEAFLPNALLSVTPEFLEQAILAAKQAGLSPVPLEDLPGLLADPSDRRRFVSFTLDDGYRNNAEFAAPVFRKLGVPYTIFLTEGFVERTRSLWWETAEALLRKTSLLRFDFGQGDAELSLNTATEKLAAFGRISRLVASDEEDSAVEHLDRAARAHGIDPLGITAELTMDTDELRRLAADPLARFGAHTLTHINLKRVDERQLRAEIEGSIASVKRFVGYPPKSFAYPYGFPDAVGDREIQAAAEAGLSIAVTTQPGVLSAGTLARPTALPRVSLNGLYQKKRYVKALMTGIPFKLM